MAGTQRVFEVGLGRAGEVEGSRRLESVVVRFRLERILTGLGGEREGVQLFRQ